MGNEFWIKTYEQNKFQSVCLDVETVKQGGEISVVSFYTPKDGPVQCDTLVKGQNLNLANIQSCLANVKLIITYNGKSQDLPSIEKEFPGVIPRVPIFDCYIMAKTLNLDTSLKTLENSFNILRDLQKRKVIASRMWNKFITYNDSVALQTLIKYNQQDTINLYPLAENLIEIAKQ